MTDTLLMNRLAILLAIFSVMVLASCKCKKPTTPDDHTVCIEYMPHKPGYAAPYTNCASCHCQALQGTQVAPSCYSCHDRLWEDNPPPDNRGTPADHMTSQNGSMHKSGLATPQIGCTSCHGSALTGSGTAPSCYQCHGDIWNGSGGIPADHTISKDGDLHKRGYGAPLTNCTSCHGSDLRGTQFAPSCYKCHGDRWTDD